jgi:hypothetical protein
VNQSSFQKKTPPSKAFSRENKISLFLLDDIHLERYPFEIPVKKIITTKKA